MAIHTLSKEAQKIIEEALQIARQHQHPEVDSSHLFFALISSSQTGKEWLERSVRDNPEEFLADLNSALSEWYPDSAEFTEPSNSYLRVMRSAEKLASETGNGTLYCSHILQAVIDLDHRLTDWLSSRVTTTAIEVGLIESPVLDKISRDLTKLAKEGKLAPVIGREKEVQDLIEVLLVRGKNSALLLGPAGVGKTALVECLAQYVVQKKVPKKLKNIRLVELNLGALLAGTSFRGEFEQRMEDLLIEINTNGNIVLVIDEFHALIGTGTTKGGGPDAVSILKPALARGELTCIGITTKDDFSRFVESDPALVRRFQIIRVSEPTPKDVVYILSQISPQYATYNHLEIPQQTIEAIVRWSGRYQPNRHFPDKAIDVLGKSCARAEMQGLNILTPDLVAEVMSGMTNVPIGDLEEGFQETLVNLDTELNKLIIGQQLAIREVCQAIKLSYLGLRDPQKPKGVFLFLGPSGVGKTELARKLAELLLGSKSALIRLDMSEYANKINISRLIGSPPGYIGYEDQGQLTKALRDRPHSVVLFDEVEKACPEVFDLFLQLFDEGRLTDSHGRTADGRNAIFIMTSNLGVSKNTWSKLGFVPIPQEPVEPDSDIFLQAYFRPEFLNRIDRIIQFRDLDTAALTLIVKLELGKLEDRVKEKEVVLSFDENVFPLIVMDARKESGARGIKTSIEKLIQIPLSGFLLQDSGAETGKIHVRANRKTIELEWI